MTDDVHLRVLAVLGDLGVDYEVMDCDPQLADTDVFCAHYGIPLDDSANTIVVASKSGDKRYAACVLLASTRLDVNKTVRKRLGVRRISFAGPDETLAMTGMTLGGVTPIGLPEVLPLWVDARVMTRERIVLGGGNRSTKILVTPELFLRTPSTDVVEDLALEPPAN